MKLTGKNIASKSVLTIFAGQSDSYLLSRKNGANIAQPIAPDTAKYGSAKISNISKPVALTYALQSSREAGAKDDKVAAL